MITPFLNTGPIRDQVPLSTLLSRLGYRPAKSTGNEELYKNVLRSSETKPTLAVNTQLDIWFDHISKKSGNIIDFGMAYWSGLDPDQVLEKINQLCPRDEDTPLTVNQPRRKRKAVKIPYYHIDETRPVGCNLGITAYLQSQGLWEMAIGHLKEVYYYVLDEKRLRKDFFAAGWQNENGGWQVISKNFSGCLGSKGMTFIPGEGKDLVVFEDYLRYLSWKYEHKMSRSSILVMNSPEFLQAATNRAEKYPEVTVYCGEEHTNGQTLAVFKQAHP